MAREYAKLKTAIWGDDDYRSLTADAQWLYQHLFSHPKIDICGVVEWSPKRIAAKASDLTESRVKAAGLLLCRHGFVIIDPETDEALVRTYIKHDNSMKGPKTAKGVMNAWADANSDLIRTVIAHEVVKIQEEHGDWSGCAEITDKVKEKAAGYSIDTLSTTYHRVSTEYSADTRPIPYPEPIGYPSDTPSETDPILLMANGYQPPLDGDQATCVAAPAPKPSNDDYQQPGFAEFWKAYPNKDDKKAAAKAYRSAVTRAPIEDIIAGAKLYRQQTEGGAKRYIKHGSTWLNGDCWQNDPGQPSTAVAKTPSQARRPSGGQLTDDQWEAAFRRAQARDQETA